MIIVNQGSGLGGFKEDLKGAGAILQVAQYKRMLNLKVDRKLIMSLDMISVFLASILALAIRDYSFQKILYSSDIWLYAVISTVMALIAWLVIGIHRSTYRYFTVPDLFHLLAAISIAVILSSFLMFTISRLDGIARSLPILQWLLCVSFTCGLRFIARRFARQDTKTEYDEKGTTCENVLIVGFNPIAELYIRSVGALYSKNLEIIGILDDDSSREGLRLNNKLVLGPASSITSMINKYRNHGIDITRIAVCLPKNEMSEKLRYQLTQFEQHGYILLDYFEERLRIISDQKPRMESKRSSFDGSNKKFQHDLYEHAKGSFGFRLTKRSLDFIGALSLLILTSPALVLISILIAIDLGRPIMFWQERPGRFKEPFRVYKFRTMRDTHDDQGNRIPEEDRSSWIGSALRRLRLDELPQLFNILMGDMSFVGPRPLLPFEQPKHTDIRLAFRPGLTGWAQINGGRDLSIANKGALDLWYIRHASVLTDIKIIFLTFKFVLLGERPPDSIVLNEALREVDRIEKDVGMENVEVA